MAIGEHDAPRFGMWLVGESDTDSQRFGAHMKDAYGSTPTAEYLEKVQRAIYDGVQAPSFPAWPTAAEHRQSLIDDGQVPFSKA